MRYQFIGLSLFFLFCSVWAGDKVDGVAVYERACKTCHIPQMAQALKSPAVHDKAAWAGRMKAAQIEAKKDPKQYPTALDYLVAQVRQGKGAMAAGGACVNQSTENKQCTDAEYKAAIEYMSQAASK